MADWYLNEWLGFFGRKQADVVRELDWNKAKVSLTASGKQPYSRDDLKQITDWLGLRPYEILMHPKDALAIRNFFTSAKQVAAGDFEAEPIVEPEDEFSPVRIPAPEPAKQRGIRKRTGTHG